MNAQGSGLHFDEQQELEKRKRCQDSKNTSMLLIWAIPCKKT